MSSMLNKRQQARNEKVLHDLIRSVPGNDKCADCGTRNPGWASWSLGIFLCIRCASLHRKLGTHVSKVKSISMDAWTNEQVESMRKNGNARSNAYFNPDPHKHPPPVSQEDADSHMERHIRAKYEYRTFRPQGNSGGGSSSSSAAAAGGSSSIKTSSSSGRRKLGMGLFRTSSPGGQGKVNQILGTNNAPYTDSTRTAPGPVVFPHGMAAPTLYELYGEQIKNLSEMGFTDVNQCLDVLKQTDGKMMDAVEILIRLNKAEDRRPEPPPKNGLTVQVHKSGPAAVLRHSVSLTTTPSGSSSNPFEELDKEQPPLPPLPLSQARTGGSMPSQHPMFFQQTLQQQSYPLQQQQPWHSQPLGYQQQPQQQQQQFAIPQNNNNPFGVAPLSSAPMQYPASTGSSYNPYMSVLPSPSNPYQQQLQSQLQPQPQTLPTNPYQQFQQAQPTPQFQQQQQFYPQQPQSIDKSQILALFNAPQLAPPRSELQIEVTGQQPPPQPQQPQQQQQQMPQAASNNPFLPATTTQNHNHRSQESVDFGAWQSGRHSPDAFASLAFGGR